MFVHLASRKFISSRVDKTSNLINKSQYHECKQFKQQRLLQDGCPLNAWPSFGEMFALMMWQFFCLPVQKISASAKSTTAQRLNGKTRLTFFSTSHAGRYLFHLPMHPMGRPNVSIGFSGRRVDTFGAQIKSICTILRRPLLASQASKIAAEGLAAAKGL